ALSTLSLHDALPIATWWRRIRRRVRQALARSPRRISPAWLLDHEATRGNRGAGRTRTAPRRGRQARTGRSRSPRGALLRRTSGFVCAEGSGFFSGGRALAGQVAAAPAGCVLPLFLCEPAASRSAARGSSEWHDQPRGWSATGNSFQA